MSSLIHIAAVSTLGLFLVVTADAQEPATSIEQLRAVVTPGDVISVTDPNGTTRGTLTEIGAEELVVYVGADAHRWRFEDVREIRRRTSDSIVNGMFIGLAIGAGLGSLPYLDNECRGDPACATALAEAMTIGAAVGALVDALIRPNRLVYRAAQHRPGMTIRLRSPVTPQRAALHVSFYF